jgi:hypothetical protein
LHLRQDFLHLNVGDDYLGHHLLPVDQLPVTLQHAASQCEGLTLGPIVLVEWAPVTDIPPLWALSSLHLLYQWPKVVVGQLLPPQGLLVPATNSGSSYIRTLWPSAHFSTFWQWELSSGHGHLERASALVYQMP